MLNNQAVLPLDFNRGTKYLHAGKYTKAISCFKKQARTNSFKELWLNMGTAYRHIDPSRVLECYLKAARDDVPFANGSFGPYTLAYNNIGLHAYAEGKDAEAIEFYTAALTIDPLYGEAVWNYANAELRSTNCVSGWDKYEYRFNRGVGSTAIDTSLPTWDGQTRGDCIVVLSEQGLGDKIMFGRYLSCLKEYFTEVVIVCHESLDCIYAPYKCVRNSSGYNLTIPICSLARIFGIVSERWLDGKFPKYTFPTSGLNIGVCWSGSKTHANDHNRSCSSHYMSELCAYGNLYSLNPDAGSARSVTALKPKDWAETASYLLGLDLVVSVDTSIVHLAGTLGVPTIMVQPLRETDFRWGNGKQPNVWYNSVICVANNNNWDTTFANVKEIMSCMK